MSLITMPSFMKTKLKEEKGAASVLVILIMVVFCLLGLLSMVYAYSNYRLSQKTFTWQEEYYALDMAGEVALQEINNLIYTSAAQAKNESDFLPIANEALNTWLAKKTQPQYKAWQPDNSLNTQTAAKAFGFALQGENNTLQIALMPQYIPNNKGEYYLILSWSIKRPDFNYDQNPFADWQLIEE